MEKKDRHDQYKHTSEGVEGVRTRQRQEKSETWKARRDQAVQSKRVRHGSLHEEEIKEEEVRETATKLVSKEGVRQDHLRYLRKAFTEGSLFIDAFLSVDNALSSLVGILTGSDEALQLEATWCLTNIAAGTHEQALALCNQAAPYLITYLSGNMTPMQDQCAWAIGNIAGDAECREALLAMGVIKPLVQLLESSSDNIKKSAAFALSNMLRNESDEVAKLLVELEAIPKLLSLTEYNSEHLEVASEAAWVLTYLAASGKHEEHLVAAGAIEKFCTLIVTLATNDAENFKLLTPTLRCLGNLCSSPSDVSARIGKTEGVMDGLAKLLTSEHRHIRKECLWALSNMEGSPEVCEELTKHEVIPKIVTQLAATFDIKTEAAYCVCNLAVHGPQFAQALLEGGAMQGMTPLLKSSDLELVHLALSFSEIMLRDTAKGKVQFEEARGLDGLEALEYHNNDTLRVMANQLLDEHFYKEDEQEESLKEKQAAAENEAAGAEKMEQT